MDIEFPDPDEEFDLVHEDEYDLLREIEDVERKKALPSQKVETSQENHKKKDEINTLTPNKESLTLAPNNNLYKQLNTPIHTIHKELSTPTTSHHDEFSIPSTSRGTGFIDNYEVGNTAKRTYDDLFGDISDIDDINGFEPRDKKPRWDQPQEIIRALLDARKKFHDHNSGVSVERKHSEEKRETISLRVPRWNFLAVTRPHDAQRIYIRVRSEQADVKPSKHSFSNLLSVPYNELKAEAEEIMVENVKRASRETSDLLATEVVENNELWVDKYRPKSYLELLSDESVNRHLLHWIKLWDKVVFNRNYVEKRKKKQQYSTFRSKKFTTEEPVEEVDKQGFPIQRIVLLSGPPGLGKTTLAHLAAKHAGYNVVEVNASDERSPDAFRQVLLASTQMKAVMGKDPRPNCLVLDEIDGAPAPAIELLLKFVQGKLVAKGKKDKGKGGKQSNICHRPVICICNEPYTPSLRALRLAALVVPVPEVSPARLVDRLLQVARKERVKVNHDALLKLAEISGCDIRSCLGALQYMGGAKLGDNLSFALKDTRKGLFDSWKQIFKIPMNRSGIFPLPERVRLVLKTVQYGESEKLAQGIFHNYPEICSEKLNHLVQCLEWFQFYDEIISLIASLQVWSVMPYTNYAFVTWHLYFAKPISTKLSYPSIAYEVRQKHAKSTGILTTIHRSSGRDSTVLAVDIAPYLPDLLCPRLRTVSGHLYSAKERVDIARLVNVLIEYGLTFMQDKNFDGTYDYKLDPNIFEVGIFPDCKQRREPAYAVKQIIVQELEAERLRRAANAINGTKNPVKTNNTTKQTESGTDAKIQNGTFKTPNSITVENPKKLKPEVKEITYKDFFGRIVTVSPDKQRSDKESNNSRNLLTKHGVWYKYKEGFSNAVRRKVIMKDLL